MLVNMIIVFAAILVLATIAAGIYFIYKDTSADKPKLKKFLRFNLVAFIPTMATALIMFVPSAVMAATGDAASAATGYGYLGAALSTGLACVGAGYAVGVVGSAALGSAALGAVSENEKILGKTLIYVGLAEGVAIYGLIISIMIIGNL